MSLPYEKNLALWFSSPKDFSECMKAIAELEKLLSCNLCNTYMDHPVTLWSCDHVFCQKCVVNMSNCQLCSLPAWPEDRQENLAVTNISRLTMSLKELLQDYMKQSNQKPDADFSEKEKTEDTNLDVVEKQINITSMLPDKETMYFETSKEVKLPGKKSKYRIAPSKPFTDIPTDSEDSVMENAAITEDSNIEEKPKKTVESNKTPLRDVHNTPKFATPPILKRKRIASIPYSPEMKTLKRLGTKTPKRLSTPQRSPSVRTPRTPKSGKKNKRGETLLHIAAIKGKIDDMKALIKEGVDLNAKDNAGWTPLHEACNHGHLDAVKELTIAGVLINTPGYEDETPLMDAVSNGHVDIVKFLLDHGADVSMRNASGKTAADLTMNTAVKEILENHFSLTQKPTSVINSPTKNMQYCCDIDHIRNRSCETTRRRDSQFSTQNQSFFTYQLCQETAPEEIIISASSSVCNEKIKITKKILNAAINMKDAKSATHYIVSNFEDDRSQRTIKYMQAVARGIWIVRCEWLDACTAAGEWTSEQKFEISGSKEDILSGGPMKSRLNRLAQCPAIFHGCHFFLSGYFKPSNPSKQQIGELLQLAGGVLLTREPKPDNDNVQTCTKVPYHAVQESEQYFHTYYIVYDGSQGKPSRMVRQGKVCTVPLTWIFDCISQFCLCAIPE